MPAINHLLRRTLATATLKHHHQYRGRTLAKGRGRGGGVGLCVNVAHVKPSTIIKSVTTLYSLPNINKNTIICTSSYSSSTPIEERENSNNNNNIKSSSRVSYSSKNYSKSSGSHQILVPDMGHEKKGNHEKEGPTKLLTLPTLLTLARVAAIPVFISTFYANNWWGTAATTSIFIIAAITDWLDGYLARKMDLGTAFGAFLDPVADKLMVAATLVLLCSTPPGPAIFGDLPWLFPVPAIAIIGREITMSAVREWAASQNTKLMQAVAVNNLGKWKTATQMTALTILLITRDTSLSDPGPLVATGVVLLYISAGLAVWSLVVYMRKILEVLLK